MEVKQTQKVTTTTRKKTLKRKINFAKYYSTEDIGELSRESIALLYEIFCKYAPLSKIGYSYRNFYHLGAGIGKTLIGIAHKNPTLQSIGIEIIPDKVQTGNSAIEKISDISLRRRIELVCISMLDDSVNYTKACWVYSTNTDDEIHRKLFDKLAKELTKGCIVVCLKSTTNSFFKEVNNVTLPTIDSINSKVYVYTKI